MKYSIIICFLLLSLETSVAQVLKGPSLCLALQIEKSIDSIDLEIQTKLINIVSNNRINKKYIQQASSFSRIALKRPSEYTTVATDCHLTFLDVEYFESLRKLHEALNYDLADLRHVSTNNPNPTMLEDVKSIDGLSFDEIEHNEIPYKVVILDLSDTTYSVQLYLGNKGEETKHSSFKTVLEVNPGTKMIMNAGMYTKEHRAQGLYIENGVILQALNLSKKKAGNFYLDPSGAFLIDSLGIPQSLIDII